MSSSTNEINNIVSLPPKKNDSIVLSVLKETLYPGAKEESISMVLNYCKARKLDPIKKSVHLVPMNVKTGIKDQYGKDIYEWRDVVMPGIGLYRIEADRSGLYAGMTEPEFGEDITEIIGSIKLTYPKWCKITVKKYVGGRIVDFTAKEFWKENYSTKSRQDVSPNSMWEKRSYGQLAKCAEAQALRKAFPDVVGQDYTKEEMEGKHFQNDSYNQIIDGKQEDVDLTLEFNEFLESIKKSDSEEQLRLVFDTIKNTNFKSRPDLFKQLIDEKDNRKSELMSQKFIKEMNEETAEVLP